MLLFEDDKGCERQRDTERKGEVQEKFLYKDIPSEANGI